MTNMKPNLSRLNQLLAVSALLSASCMLPLAHAADNDILTGAVTITTDDVLADAALRIPEQHRAEVLRSPDAVKQIAGNLYVRRVMAEMARKAGMDQTVEAKSALQLMQDKVLSDAWLEQIDKKATISDSALESLASESYKAKPERFKHDEQISVSHILINGLTEASKIKSQALLAQLKAGTDFAKLAEEESQDTASAKAGGDLGWFENGTMVPEFEQAAEKLKNAGDLSDVVETKFGYHIIKLNGRRPAGPYTFAEAKPGLMKSLLDKKRQDARSSAADQIRDGATLNIERIKSFSLSIKP